MNEYAKERILPKLSQNLQRIREIAHNSSDLLVNEFVLSGLPAALLCCEGMLSTSTITELILRPMSRFNWNTPQPNRFSTHPETPTLFHRPCRGFELSGFIPLFKLRLCGFGFRWLPESVGFWGARLRQTQRFHALR